MLPQNLPATYRTTNRRRQYDTDIENNSEKICLTDGNGNLMTTFTAQVGGTKEPGARIAPDGSAYVILTDGEGNYI